MPNVINPYEIRSKAGKIFDALLQNPLSIQQMKDRRISTDPLRMMNRYLFHLKNVEFQIGPFDNIKEAWRRRSEIKPEHVVKMTFDPGCPLVIENQATAAMQQQHTDLDLDIGQNEETKSEKKKKEESAKAVVYAKTCTIKVGDSKPVTVDKMHKRFPELLETLAAGCHVWLAGPAGSGKTTGARLAAEALKRDFYFNGAIDTEYKLSGFVDGQGRIIYTPFRQAWENGGLYLFDEVDASLPSATLAFNAALSGDYCDFPGRKKPVKKHPKFLCVAAGNTWGFGGTSNYVGRNKQDGAFLDRFATVAWDYDEDLERLIAGNDKWTNLVQIIRHAVAERGLKIIVSPRASIMGARMLKAGVPKERVLNATIKAKCSEQDWENIAADLAANGVTV